MGFRIPSVIRKPASDGNRAASAVADVPKGYLVVYVGDDGGEMKRFVIPVTYLNQPSFQDLLSRSEEEFGFDHPMGGLTIPCREHAFLHLISHFN
uniref:Small auxin up regulated protein n=1 Tax=Boehmeria nivea TaxID=83906 RepID=A0A172J202_BOENI|nr:small auxin up regulated protein [Boehmeria nivea]